MDSNVTKNTFLYKFFKIDFANNKLGIKQVLQQQLLRAIYLYRQRNKIEDSWDRVIVSLPDKLILCDVNKQKIASEKNFILSAGFNYWVYRCAIAFPLASYCGIKPLKMAQELVDFFPDVKFEQVTKSHIKIMITIIPPGWIDFEINHDFLGAWWQQLISKLDSNHNYRIEIDACHKNLHFLTTNPNLFTVNYYHDRCCSLLKLGEREGLIQLDNHNFESLAWQISKPHPIIWFDVKENFLLVQPQELNLLRSLLLILDNFDGLMKVPLTKQAWLNCALNLCKALEQFIIACRFCGEVKRQNPQLAIATLGLIAVVQWCLFKLMGEKLQVTPIALSEV